MCIYSSKTHGRGTDTPFVTNLISDECCLTTGLPIPWKKLKRYHLLTTLYLHLDCVSLQSKIIANQSLPPWFETLGNEFKMVGSIKSYDKELNNKYPLIM